MAQGEEKETHQDTVIYLLKCLKLSLIIPVVGEDVEQLEPSFICQWNVKWYNHFGKQFGSVLKSEAYTYHVTQQGRSRGKDYKGHEKKTFVGVKDLLITLIAVMVDSWIYLLKLIKLCTLNMCSLLYVSYTFTSC